MINYEVDMSVDYEAMGCVKPEKAPTLTAYILDKKYLGDVTWKVRPAVIICPGGAYGFVSPREAEPIAMSYCAAGFHAFVLDYSIAPTGWPAACCELSKSVAYVRGIADEYGIDKDRIIVCGFSAGGHLAASIGVHYDKEVVKKFSNVTGEENKPNGMILSYPVITDDLEKTHMGTYENFVEGREEAAKFFGLEHYVTAETPKTFIWHTYTDDCVPVENSLKFASALCEHKVSTEMHIFEKGQHGLSLGSKLTASDPGGVVPCVYPWMQLSIDWINRF